MTLPHVVDRERVSLFVTSHLSHMGGRKSGHTTYAPPCNNGSPFSFVKILRNGTTVHDIGVYSFQLSDHVSHVVWIEHGIEPHVFPCGEFEIKTLSGVLPDVPPTAVNPYMKDTPTGGLCKHMRWQVMADLKRPQRDLPIEVLMIPSHRRGDVEELLRRVDDFVHSVEEREDDEEGTYSIQFVLSVSENLLPVCSIFHDAGLLCMPDEDNCCFKDVFVDRIDRFKHFWVTDFHEDAEKAGPCRESENWPMQFLPSTLRTAYSYEGIAAQLSSHSHRTLPEPLRTYVANRKIRAEELRSNDAAAELARVREREKTLVFLEMAASASSSVNDEDVNRLKSACKTERDRLDEVTAVASRPVSSVTTPPTTRKLTMAQQAQALTCFYFLNINSKPEHFNICKMVLFQYYLNGFIVRYKGNYTFTGEKRCRGMTMRQFKNPENNKITMEQRTMLQREDGSLRCEMINKGFRGYNRHMTSEPIYEPSKHRRLQKRESLRDDRFNPLDY